MSSTFLTNSATGLNVYVPLSTVIYLFAYVVYTTLQCRIDAGLLNAYKQIQQPVITNTPSVAASSLLTTGMTFSYVLHCSRCVSNNLLHVC